MGWFSTWFTPKDRRVAYEFFPSGTTACIESRKLTQEDVEYIVPRVLELTFTAQDLRSFGKNLSFDGEPFRWDEDHRLQLRCELDAFIAHLYGLSREELRYVLDPKSVFGQEFPK